MSFLYLLAGLRSPFLNQVMLLVTEMGDETILLICGLTLFWCLDKRWGYRVMAVAFMAMGLTMLIKVLVMQPRPWVLDPAFQAVEAAKGRAYDYSFPSGHSSTSAALFGMLALYSEKKPLKVLFPCCALLVGFSRMYLGVHTPQDVLTGLAIGFGCVLLSRPLLDRAEKTPRATTALQLCLVGFLALSLVIQLLKPASARSDAELDAATLCDTGSLLGASLALVLIQWLDRRYIRFANDTVWWLGLIRLFGGFALVMGVRMVLKAVLPTAVWSNALRYFMMMMAGGVAWTACFPKLEKLRRDGGAGQ